MKNLFLAIYCCVATYTSPVATQTLVADRNIAMVELSTTGVVRNIDRMIEQLDENAYAVHESTPLPFVDDWQWIIGRGRAQGLAFAGNGNAKIVLKVSTPVEFPVVWATSKTFSGALTPATPIDSRVHWILGQSTAAVAGYISARKRAIGDDPTVYWMDEYDMRPQFSMYVGPRRAND